jgi:hypothetical protein
MVSDYVSLSRRVLDSGQNQPIHFTFTLLKK